LISRQDRVYTKGADVPKIWDVGFILFWKHIICPPIDHHIYSAILGRIQIERDGDVIHRSAVKECVDVLLQLRLNGYGPSVYEHDLEPAILRESEAFYKTEADGLLETCDASEYLGRVSFLETSWESSIDLFQVESRFESEASRTHHYLSSRTSAPLRQILEKNLLTSNLSTIVTMPNSGLDVMIDTDKLDDLSRLYRLFIMFLPVSHTFGRRSKNILCKEEGRLTEHLQGRGWWWRYRHCWDEKGEGKGKARAADDAQMLSLPLKWVQDVLDLKDKFDHVWRVVFQCDRDLESA
jgi:cullin 3